jgi:hypothetical protein
LPGLDSNSVTLNVTEHIAAEASSRMSVYSNRKTSQAQGGHITTQLHIELKLITTLNIASLNNCKDNFFVNPLLFPSCTDTVKLLEA